MIVTDAMILRAREAIMAENAYLSEEMMRAALEAALTDPASEHLEQAQQNLEAPTPNRVRVIWTRHGHWIGQGTPTEEQLAVRPYVTQRCGGPGLCSDCSVDASGLRR